MKLKPILLSKRTTLLFLVCFVTFSCKKEKPTGETAGYAVLSSNDSLCIETPSWFPHVQTPAPEEGVGSPFDTTSTTNAIFHQWSWQKFLWLTKPTIEIELIPIIVQGAPDPIVIIQKAPLFLNQAYFSQVTSHMDSVSIPSGAALVLTDTAQAGSGGVLRTNPAYAPENNSSETVYYSIYMSNIMLEAAEIFKARINSGALPKNNLETFPVGSVELKVSWVDKKAIPEDKIDNYFTTVGAISTDGGNTYSNTEVALLGMHVVGVVENHPEFIWATFEHDDLAPDYDWVNKEASSSTDQVLFAEGQTTGLAGITFSNGSADSAYKAYDLFQYGVPADTAGLLQNTSQTESINYDNIRDINACVKANLNDVWNNYFYNGSIWADTDGIEPVSAIADTLINNGNLNSAEPGSLARGSLNCANVTMETFTQTFQSSIDNINVGNLVNCFTCHGPTDFSSPSDSSALYFSHVFNASLLEGEGKSMSEIETLKAKEELLLFLKKNP